MTLLDPASRRQNQAADPTASTWLSANAGSGKTRVLTDRVARLLLDGVRPQNILCLTYTKAAASEMQNRLFRRLGEWSMMPDARLAAALARMGVDAQDGCEQMAQARRLFARAIETPGGLRIQTIHGFCASVLRRFPLEAGVPPGFTEMDDRTAALLRDEVIETLASVKKPVAVDAVAAQLANDTLSDFADAVIRFREPLGHGAQDHEIWRWFGLAPGFDETQLLRATFDVRDAGLIADIVPVLRASSKTTDRAAAEKLAGLVLAPPTTRDLDILCDVLLTGPTAKEPFSAKIGSFPTKDCRASLAGRLDHLTDLMKRIETARGDAIALFAAEKTHALYRFAADFLPAYEARKQQLGWLDFDDLIFKTRELLSNEAVAAWVLYRLDGGLDHILVDEAQDTSPVQWQVIERLAQEFTAGLGARDDVRRTIFVVGDKKQSIYSFQGADPGEFDRMREHFDARLQAAGHHLRALELEYSFRSSDAILRFVDATLAGVGGPGPMPETRHRAFHDTRPGRVDLWPPVPVADQPEKRHWYDAVDVIAPGHQDAVLAGHIADHIGVLIQKETIPAKNGEERKISAGDILVLVRRRSGLLFEEIIRACKSRGLPVAGADRLKLGAELAIKDLLALMGFLATPEDDLSLAAALRSPLFGWTEADLYNLAAGRDGVYLWAALRARAGEFPETMGMISDLRNSADFLRPYDLIERIITRHDGRRRLLARLGPEAEDGIDAMLTQALSYEVLEIPSLTGFLVWMEVAEVEVKRQMDSAGDLIRVMTIHGAKGLESPVVILPDTAVRPLRNRDEVVTTASGHPIWKTAANRQPTVMAEALSRLKRAQEEEAQRLFYVAATRAESWLIIAAAGKVGSPGQSWHQMAQAGLQTLGALPFEAPTGVGLRLQHGTWKAGSAEETAPRGAPTVLPAWTTIPVSPPPRPAPTLVPSDLGGEKAISRGETGPGPDEALEHGRRVHLLLERLPVLPAAGWADAALRIARPGTDRDAERAWSEAQRVLSATQFSHIFAANALAEVDLAAALPAFGGRRMIGTVDRLVVNADHILAVDFKTNVAVPGSPEEVPDGICRQLGAYLSALEQIYPDRPIEVAVLWTRVPSLMVLPHEIVRAALLDAATS